MDNNIQKVLKKIEIISENRNLPIIGPRKGRLLGETVDKHKPKRILEVGTLIGYSAITMAQFLPEGGTITTIEIRIESAEMARENIAGAGFSERIEIVTGKALEVIPKLDGKFDMLFLDAAKEEYYKCLKSCEPRLSRKAVIVADNVKIFKSEVEDYLDYVKKGGRYKSKTFDFGSDAMEISERI